jgi:hypothetical protein
MAQFLCGKKFQSAADVEVAVEKFFAFKNKEWFYQASRNWLKMGENH